MGIFGAAFFFADPSYGKSQKAADSDVIHQVLTRLKVEFNKAKTLEDLLRRVKPQTLGAHKKTIAKYYKKYGLRRLPQMVGNGPSLYIFNNEIRVESRQPLKIFFNGKRVSSKIFNSPQKLEKFVRKYFRHSSKKALHLLLPRAHAAWALGFRAVLGFIGLTVAGSAVEQAALPATGSIGSWLWDKETSDGLESSNQLNPQDLDEMPMTKQLLSEVEGFQSRCNKLKNSIENRTLEGKEGINRLTPDQRDILTSTYSKARIEAQTCKMYNACKNALLEHKTIPEDFVYKSHCEITVFKDYRGKNTEMFFKPPCTLDIFSKAQEAEFCLRQTVTNIYPNYFSDEKGFLDFPRKNRSLERPTSTVE